LTHVQIYADGNRLTHTEVHHLWVSSPTFALFYSRQLVEPGDNGFCWETPPVTKHNVGTPHEFVVIASDAHAGIRANPAPFSEHFRCTNQPVVAFQNLGRDGVMIAPVPDGKFDGGSIGPFLRTATEDQIIALWCETGKQARHKLGKAPMWISTAGLGVNWLHVRIDSQPKYYRYNSYKNLN